MRFRVSHTTEYKYLAPASESFAELRVWPQSNGSQQILERRLITEPQTMIDHYVDYFGNHVEFFSIPYRHNFLRVTAEALVETHPLQPPETVLEVTLAEARQVYNHRLYQLFEFLQPSALVPFDQHGRIRTRFFREAASLGSVLRSLNTWLFENFAYSPGVTDISTPLAEVVRKRKGVCQDFAHLMLAILRSNGIPARYVSGYIEACDPEQVPDPKLIGAAASHAWVEVFLPGGFWWGLDPTNNQSTGERHVVVAVGRDYNDVAPMRGTYKGAVDQKLNVMVSLKRQNVSNPTS